MCKFCKICLYDTGYLCRHLKSRTKRISKKPTTGRLYILNVLQAEGKFAVLQAIKTELIRTGTRKEIIKITY